MQNNLSSWCKSSHYVIVVILVVLLGSLNDYFLAISDSASALPTSKTADVSGDMFEVRPPRRLKDDEEVEVGAFAQRFLFVWGDHFVNV